MKNRRSEHVQARGQARTQACPHRPTRQYRKNTSQEPSYFMDEAEIQLRHELRESTDEKSPNMETPLVSIPQGPLDALRW